MYKHSPNEDLTRQQICKKSSMLTCPCLLAYLKVNEDKTGVLSLNPSLASASKQRMETPTLEYALCKEDPIITSL